MDFAHIPSCSEVNSWSPVNLSVYFKARNLRDCEKYVKKHSISGKVFLELSENDMQKFPKTRVPMLIKIQQDIHRKEEKRAFLPKRAPTHKIQQETECISEDFDGTDSDSFDDDDYENPDESDEADYESPADPAEEDNCNSDYEPPPSNNEDPIVNPAKLSQCNSEYIGRVSCGNPIKSPPESPLKTESGPSKFTASRFLGYPAAASCDEDRLPDPSNKPAPKIDRRTKPSVSLSYTANAGKSNIFKEKNIHDKASTLPSRQQIKEMEKQPRKPPTPFERNIDAMNLKPLHLRDQLTDKRTPTVETDDLQRQFPHSSLSNFSSNTYPLINPKTPYLGSTTLQSKDRCSSRGSMRKLEANVQSLYKTEASVDGSLSSSCSGKLNQIATECENLFQYQWYTGNISRQDAEDALKLINQDGTFLVRDSSQSTTSQPYVLMVLYKDKVYNVRIRYNQHDKVYLLGSGRQETFLSVSEIITFFQRTPLLLIDGKDRGSRNHCKLKRSIDKLGY